MHENDTEISGFIIWRDDQTTVHICMAPGLMHQRCSKVILVSMHVTPSFQYGITLWKWPSLQDVKLHEVLATTELIISTEEDLYRERYMRCFRISLKT